MPGLIFSIQEDALNPDVSVSNLLRKVKLAAAKLGLEETEAWVESELSGYKNRTDLPSYRQLTGQPKVHNPYNGWMPIHGEPSAVRQLSRTRCHQSVAEIEDLLRGDDVSSQFTTSLPPEIINILNRSNGTNFGEAAVFVSRSSLFAILDVVRNKVLEWSIALEKKGISGEGLSFSTAEKAIAQEVRPSVYIHNVHTLTGNIGSGNSSGAISSHTTNTDAALFSEIADALKQAVTNGEEQQKILLTVVKMQEARSNPQIFATAYGEFITLAAAHVSTIAPFLPALARFLA